MHESSLLEWPAPERNKEPIAEVLTRVFPPSGLVLEVASGTGQHAEHFARVLPQLIWQPTDCDPELLDALSARATRAALPNLRGPLRLDASEEVWPVREAQALFNANMIHIAPWEVTLGLMQGAASVLPSGGVMVTYGPYRIGGRHTSESNERFDTSLRERDPRWGVRNLDEVSEVAARYGLTLIQHVSMPANNFCVVWHKQD